METSNYSDARAVALHWNLLHSLFITNKSNHTRKNRFGTITAAYGLWKARHLCWFCSGLSKYSYLGNLFLFVIKSATPSRRQPSPKQRYEKGLRSGEPAYGKDTFFDVFFSNLKEIIVFYAINWAKCDAVWLQYAQNTDQIKPPNPLVLGLHCAALERLILLIHEKSKNKWIKSTRWESLFSVCLKKNIWKLWFKAKRTAVE